MGSKSRYQKSKARKRKFKGNQYLGVHEASKKIKSGHKTESNGLTKVNELNIADHSQCSPISEPSSSNVQTRLPEIVDETPRSSRSASARKIRQVSENVDGENDFFYFFLDSSLFLDLLKSVAFCPTCKVNLMVEHIERQKAGLCHAFQLNCTLCGWSREFKSSKEVRKGGSGRNSYDVNDRSMIAFREIGRGFAGMKRFCGIMNIMPPLNRGTYSDKMAKLHDAYLFICQKSMKKAALESREMVEENVTADISSDIDVSLDGTWQHRGHTSFNGVVTAISQENGKCVDFEVMSKSCQACRVWERKKGTNQTGYEDFKTNHSCRINHVSSSGAMESEGAIKIFQRSVEVNKLRYKTYIGDGDSSAYQKVVESKPYEGLIPQKAECIGHVQKRVGSRLRNLKKIFKGKLSDGKPLDGKGRLTEKIVNTLQNAFGMAIRQNTNSVYAMKKAIAALLHHYSCNETEEKRHHFCPRGEHSWCKYQSDKVTGRDTYRPSINMPLAIKDKIKPIFLDLSSEELLSKCLHGRTQNANEALNHLIWKRCPKNVYVERFALETCVASAVIDFNDGASGIVDIFEHMGMKPGKALINFCNASNIERIAVAERQDTKIVKLRRKQLRGLKKGYLDKEDEIENEKASYETGMF